MGCVTICISDELEIAFRRLFRLMVKNRVKCPEGRLKQYLTGVSERGSNYWMRTNYLKMNGDNMANDNSKDPTNEDNFDLHEISWEVDKFLKEKEKHIMLYNWYQNHAEMVLLNLSHL